MNANNGLNELKVEEELEDYADTLESLHDPKNRHEILSRKNTDVKNTFLGMHLACWRVVLKKKGKEKLHLSHFKVYLQARLCIK